MECNCPSIAAVALIICSRNRPAMLLDTLKSIFLGDQIPSELIVVDQSDQPNQNLEAFENVPGCELRYLWSDSMGLSRANNLGAEAARKDLLVFTHDDVQVSPRWLSSLVQSLEKAGNSAVVTGRILATSAEIAGGFAPTLRVGTEPLTHQGRIGMDVLKPLNMALYRSTLRDVGGFDERLGPGTPFPGAEDSDLGFRLLEAGYRILYVPEALVYHRAWRPRKEYLPLRWRYGVAQGAFYAKHLGFRDRYILGRMIRDSLRRARHFPKRLWKEGYFAFGDLLFVAGSCVGVAKWLRSRWQ